MSDSVAEFQKNTPEINSRPEREKFLLQLYERGITTKDCVAFHGTSLESIQYLLDHGFLPGHTGAPDNHYNLPQTGDIYFYPRKNIFPFRKYPQLKLVERNISSGEVTMTGRKFEIGAEIVARNHRFFSLLNKPLNSEETTKYSVSELIDSVLSNDMEETKLIAQKLETTEEQLKKAALEAVKRHGILLGLKRDALSYFLLSPGDGEVDFRLHTKENGLALNCLSGLKVLGDEEKKFFEDLK